jgi:hypothetical protein
MDLVVLNNRRSQNALAFQLTDTRKSFLTITGLIFSGAFQPVKAR